MRPLLTALIVLLLLASCGRDTPTGSTPGEPPVEFTYSPEDSLEAKLLALWWSREVVPPDSLMGEFLYDLAYLRYASRDSIPEIDDLRFIPYWVPSRIVVQFDVLTGPEVEKGNYTGWDGLDSQFQPSYIGELFDWFFAIGFSDVVHSLRMAEIYRELPGVLSSQADAYGCVDVCPFPIYPARCGSLWTYLFEDNRGRPRSIRYIYFRCDDEGPALVGVWCPFENEAAPDWWEEASANLREFHRD